MTDVFMVFVDVDDVVHFVPVGHTHIIAMNGRYSATVNNRVYELAGEFSVGTLEHAMNDFAQLIRVVEMKRKKKPDDEV